MKKFIVSILMLAVLAVMVPLSANAQTRYSTYKKPNVYQRHRNAFNIGIGTAAGALLGAIIGGKKGAALGALGGAGGGALYTYKIRPKQTRYYSRYNRNY